MIRNFESKDVYENNRKWSDKFIREIKKIVGEHLLCVSTFEQDTQQASDLVVLSGKNLSIACRVRRPGYLNRYPNQFTVRSRVASGNETELSKIINGWGDWFFYGHSNDQQNAIEDWMLLDLTSFRSHMIRDGYLRNVYDLTPKINWGETPNGDGTYFAWFDVESFPSTPPIIIARHQRDEQMSLVV